MMDHDEMLKNLHSLCQLDIDAIHAYNQAIEKIDIESIRNTMTTYREDHERHVQLLSTIIRQQGGQPPEFKKDIKGYLIQGFTALRSVSGTEGSLKAMQTNENLTNRHYGEAVNWDVPIDIKQILQQNYRDEQKHLHYINQAIDNRAWEQKAA